MFRIRLTKEAGGRNYNFYPGTYRDYEAKLIIRLIEEY
jgi:hypothetical protein